MKIDLSKMCYKCLRMVSDSEDTYGFKLVDDNGFECVFQGHKHCIEEVSETLSQLYGGNDDES